MLRVPGRRKTILGPVVRVFLYLVSTVSIAEAERLTQSNPTGYPSCPCHSQHILTPSPVQTHIDINSAGSCSRCSSTSWPSIIVDKRHNNASLAHLVFDVFQVIMVGERRSLGCAVLVLRLVQNDWSAIGDLSFRDDLGDVGYIAGRCQY